jgi:hypothetical protein
VDRSQDLTQGRKELARACRIEHGHVADIPQPILAPPDHILRQRGQ